MVLWSDLLFTRAHAFYEKHGFVRRGGLRPLKDYPGVIEAGYAKPLAKLVVEELDIAAAESAERKLTTLLPLLPREKALAAWRVVTRAVGQRQARLFLAWLDGEIVGTVHLRLDMPEEQFHRAELHQLLVSPGVSHQEVPGALLQAAEAAARGAGLRLLVADTPCEALFGGLGWSVAGAVPGYLVDSAGQPQTVTRLFKHL